MFSFISELKLIALGMLLVLMLSAYSYYVYQIDVRESKIIKLKNKSVVQDIEINNLNTNATVQKNINKNKVFEEVQKSKKEDIQNVSKTNDDTNIDVAVGKHNITL